MRASRKAGIAVLLAVLLPASLCCAFWFACEPAPDVALPSPLLKAIRSPDSVALYAPRADDDHLNADAIVDDALFWGGDRLGNTAVFGHIELGAAERFLVAGTLHSMTAEGSGRMCSRMSGDSHILRARSQGHVYDFTFHHECGIVRVSEQGEELGTLALNHPAKAVFDRLLRWKSVPLSFAGMSAQQHALETKKHARLRAIRADKDAAWERAWLTSAPRSLRPLIGGRVDFSLDQEEIGAFDHILSKEFPNEPQRILALLTWYGADNGPWSWSRHEKSPMYGRSKLVEELIAVSSAREIFNAVQSATLTPQQLEGTAKLLGLAHWWPPQDLPEELRAMLRTHVLQHSDPANHELARQLLRANRK